MFKTSKKKFWLASPMIANASGGGGGFSAKAVHFDGATYIASTTSSGLTTTDGVKYAASFWFRLLGGDSSYLILFENSRNDGFSLQRDNGNHWEADALRSDFNAVSSVTVYGQTNTADSTWHHLAISADETNNPNGVFSVAIDGNVISGNGFTQNTGNIAFTSANTITIGGRNGGSLFMQGDIAELWIAYNQYVDFTNSTNIQKFRSTAGHPVNLGSNGSIPTGTAPTCYFSAQSAASDFLTNRGTGGLSFAVASGTLTLGSVNP